MSEKPYLNPYTVMWIFVFFDIPVKTKSERKFANNFRKALLKEGFDRIQYSVYARFCGSRDAAKGYIKRVEKMIRKYGQVSILQVTDKQYSEIINFYGTERTKINDPPKQLELF
ncbi:MAG: CRISPR-associated endonuclease Cas2 [Candidatus Kapaibacterium sp.]